MEATSSSLCAARTNILRRRDQTDQVSFSDIDNQLKLITCFFSDSKGFRRIAARYDELAANFLAALKRVAVCTRLRHNEPSSQILNLGAPKVCEKFGLAATSATTRR